jgi:hypothetical protein
LQKSIPKNPFFWKQFPFFLIFWKREATRADNAPVIAKTMPRSFVLQCPTHRAMISLQLFSQFKTAKNAFSFGRVAIFPYLCE